jgi:signal transduction histidine kinase
MSHEIRTPLNAVIGLTDLLRLTPLNEEQQDFVDTIHNSGSMLLSLMNDILDFSKIEADKLELERRGFDLHRCVQDVVGMMTSLAEEKGLGLRAHIAPEVPRRSIG